MYYVTINVNRGALLLFPSFGDGTFSYEKGHTCQHPQHKTYVYDTERKYRVFRTQIGKSTHLRPPQKMRCILGPNYSKMVPLEPIPKPIRSASKNHLTAPHHISHLPHT